MNGVTGRMGTNQHLVRSIVAIRNQGGVAAGPGQVLWPEPLLVGRDERKLSALAAAHGLDAYTTDLESALADPDYEVYFDAQVTSRREPAVRAAIEAGKHVYCEKPITEDLDSALALARLAHGAGIKHGVVQDKLFLPGLRTLKRLLDGGALGRVLSVRGEFGYWVFPGPDPAPQRPSWNYRAEDGGGIVADMFSHWRYVLDELFGSVRGVFALGATHLPIRHDEQGQPYDATAEDAAYAMFELDGGVIAQLNSSWCVRVDRDELFELQVDGTEGTAVAGLRDCRLQPAAATPRRGVEPRPGRPDRAPRRLAPGAGRRIPTTRSRCSGSGSCATSPSTSRSRGTSGPPPAACSSPSSACGRGRNGAGSRCRSCDGDRHRIPAPPARGRAAGAVRARRAAGVRGRRHPGGVARRVRRRPCGRRPAQVRARRPRRARLGGDARVPPPPLGARPRGRRGDGHGPARHGSGLGGRARADPPLRRPRRAPAAAGWPPAPRPIRARHARSARSAPPTRSSARSWSPRARR